MKHQLNKLKLCNNVWDMFCAASSSKVSIDKSKIYLSRNINSEVRTIICECLGMDSNEDFGKYLRVPTINGRTSKKRLSVFGGSNKW